MKKYFSDIDECCYPLSHYKEYMAENNIKELKLFEAKMEVGNEYFYCREFFEIGQVGESCGKVCDEYAPRNGKNGRCIHSANIYEQTEIVKILKL